LHIPCIYYENYENYEYGANFHWNEFNIIGESQTIIVSATPSNYGSVSIIGDVNDEDEDKYICGKEITVTATPNPGRGFLYWTEKDTNGNDSVVSIDPNYTFIVKGPRELVAHFETESYTIILEANPPEAADILTGAGIYDYDSLIVISVVPNICYTFKNWTKEDGTVVSTSLSFPFTVKEPCTLTANFEIITYGIQLHANNGGTVEGDSTYNCGEEITVKAIPDHCYLFEYWKEDSVEVATCCRIYREKDFIDGNL